MQEVNAKKVVLGATDALNLVEQANELHVARGKKVVHVNLKKETPDKDELRKMLLGPTGNLRAPAMVVGKKLIVGFNEDMYRSIFK